MILAVDCGILPIPMNGSSSGDSTVFPHNVLFHCDHGFILSGSTIRTCQPNGTWSGLPTLCSGRFETKFEEIRKACLVHTIRLGNKSYPGSIHTSVIMSVL